MITYRAGTIARSLNKPEFGKLLFTKSLRVAFAYVHTETKQEEEKPFVWIEHDRDLVALAGTMPQTRLVDV